MTPQKKTERVRAVPITQNQMRVLTLYKAGVPQVEIARVLGVSKQAVNKVIKQLRTLGLLNGEQS